MMVSTMKSDEIVGLGAAAKIAGVNRQMVFRWVQRYPDLSRHVYGRIIIDRKVLNEIVKAKARLTPVEGGAKHGSEFLDESETVDVK